MTGSLFARKTWFTADLHLGHERIISLCNRPFETVDEMNKTIIEKWNERVDPQDTVWVLGNAASGAMHTPPRSTADGLVLCNQLHGHKILVAGDYDQCFHGYWDGNGAQTVARRDFWTAQYRDAGGFADVVTGKAMLKRTGKPVIVPLRPEFGMAPVLSVQLSHFPRAGDSPLDSSDRYARYRPRPAGASKVDPWLVHGHVHNAWTVNGRQVNVGVDVWDFAPVSAETLLSVITEGMPSCDCSGESHQMGTPGCVLNGG